MINKLPVVFKPFNNIASIPCNHALAANFIQMSRVNEYLCCEAEPGRIHGRGEFKNGYWYMPGGIIRINLHVGNSFHPGGLIVPCSPFDFYKGGEPLIERFINGFPVPENHSCNTQFLYLLASCFGIVSESFPGGDCLCGMAQHARDLGSGLGLSGNFGDKNFICSGNWYTDISTISVLPDSCGFPLYGKDRDGNIKYMIQLFQLLPGCISLPTVYLRRSNFGGVRRAFLPPEGYFPLLGSENIAIPSVQYVILTDDPGMLVYGGTNYNTGIGFVPGGADSVSKCDFSVMKGKEIFIPIFYKNSRESVHFAVNAISKIRRELRQNATIAYFESADMTFPPNCYKNIQATFLTNCVLRDLSIPELCSLATQHGIFIPKELQSDYFCNITGEVEQNKKEPLISGVMSSGDMIIINGEKNHVSLTVAAGLAANCEGKCNLWPENYVPRKHFKAVAVIDGASDRNGKTFIGKATKIVNTKFLSAGTKEEILERFAESIGKADVVIFAATTLYGVPERFEEIVRWCKPADIAVVVVALETESAPMKEFRRIADAILLVKSVDNKDGMAFAVIEEDNQIEAVELHFDSKGTFVSSKPLSSEKKDALKPPRTVAAAPFDGKCFDGMKGMSPEEKFAAIKNGNQKLILPP